ncbi:sensor histidine kinase [Pseudobacteriovorax antillogorgiicola]|uniref:histidine kinase n=1 Tax=Pseudobacteriovorax antillogorgiicola TaxID=1513793 RepID=A0A1Y6BX51_9BACT|nr:HAMP domain-containing sensor histidine kinase [Pseudobacteriovorax antillogorgiicola]TCS53119.1 signal transduction histidine kinase [Pseudobacteriovorax antillogorgiicola]SMF25490.1 Signal transduction histidine kinase [Pseudobacteriovorax antillogorgiicola]
MNFLEPDFSLISNDHAAKLEWLARLRLVAAFGQLVMVPIGLYNGFIPYDSLMEIFGLISLLLIMNLLIWKSMRRKKAYPEHTVFIHLCIDFVFFSLFLSLSSGFLNPLINLCFLHFAIVGLNVSPKFGAMFFCWATALLGLVFASSVADPWNSRMMILLGTYIFVGLTILVVSQWFSRTMSRYKESIHHLRVQLGKVDSLRASGLVAANLCHELSTPINDAVLKVGMIRHHDQKLERHRLCDDVENLLLECGDRLQSLFSDASMEEGQRFVATDIGQLVSRTANSWRSHLCPHLHMEIQIPDQGIIKAIPRMLFIRTFMDFLDNARDAIGSRDGALKVTVKALRDASVEVAVEDNGPGFQETIKDKIGTPFLTNKESGVGLGLYTASHLAFHLGGDFQVGRSSLGGAKVCLQF